MQTFSRSFHCTACTRQAFAPRNVQGTKVLINNLLPSTIPSDIITALQAHDIPTERTRVKLVTRGNLQPVGAATIDFPSEGAASACLKLQNKTIGSSLPLKVDLVFRNTRKNWSYEAQRHSRRFLRDSDFTEDEVYSGRVVAIDGIPARVTAPLVLRLLKSHDFEPMPALHKDRDAYKPLFDTMVHTVEPRGAEQAEGAADKDSRPTRLIRTVSVAEAYRLARALNQTTPAISTFSRDPIRITARVVW